MRLRNNHRPLVRNLLAIALLSPILHRIVVNVSLTTSHDQNSETLSNWAKRHVEISLRGLRAGEICSNTIDVYDQLVNYDLDIKKKLALVHITSEKEVVIQSSTIDAFTANYVTHFVGVLEAALSKIDSALSSLTFIVTSTAFAEQVGRAELFITKNVALFSSCMQAQTAESYGVFIPRPYPAREWMTQDNRLEKQSDTRKKTAVFRGALSSIDRALLLKKVQGLRSFEKQWLDVNITKVPEGAPCAHNRQIWCHDAPSTWIKTMNLAVGGQHMSMKTQVKEYSSIVSVDGVGCADRLKILLSSQSVVFIQNSPMKEFWYSDLRPWKHFVPVRRDFSDLIERVSSLYRNHLFIRDEEVRIKITNSASEYIRQYVLHNESNSEYMRLLLQQYGKLNPGKCPAPSEARPFTQWRKTVKII